MNLSGTRKYYFPILVLLIWLMFTIYVFSFGPYEYKITHPFRFYTYLFLVHAALLAGYARGQRSYGRGFQFRINYYRFVKVTIIVSLLYFLIKTVFTFGGDINSFTETFTNASWRYRISNVKHSNLFSYIDIFFTPVFFIAVTNTIFSYKNLGKPYRYSVFLLMFFSVAASIGSATRSGIIQLAVISMAAFALGIYKKNIILNSYKKLSLFILASIMVTGFFIYSAHLINTRGGKIIINPLTGEKPRDDYFLSRITSNKIHPLINNVSFYVAHSYYRLNQAMDLPFKGFGFGLTNSYFLMDNIESITGISALKEKSYGVRLDKSIGSNYGLYWSTFYTWIASDFSFPGTIIVIFFIGYYFSLSLKDVLYSPNPLAVTVFCSHFYFIFHFAFNNPLQDGAGLTTFLVLPLIWLIGRKKYINSQA